MEYSLIVTRWLCKCHIFYLRFSYLPIIQTIFPPKPTSIASLINTPSKTTTG